MRRDPPKPGEPRYLITNPTPRQRMIERGLMIAGVIAFAVYAYLNFSWMVEVFR